MLLLLLLFVFFLNLSSVQAKTAVDLSQANVGARPLGMGKAFVGLADDSNSLFLNPAGLTQLKDWQLTSMSGKFINEIPYTQIALAYPVKFGTLAIGYLGSGLNFSAPGITSEVVDSNRQYRSSTLETMSFNQNYHLLLFSFGRNLAIKGFSFGTTLKLYFQDLSGTQLNTSSFGSNLDLGLLYQPSSALSFGLVQQNLMPTFLGAGVRWGGNLEALPSATKLGIALKLKNHLKILNDLELRSSLLLFHPGLEWTLRDHLSLRVGLDPNAYQKPEGGLGVDYNLTAGIGLLYGGFGFDVAYHEYQGLTQNTSYYFSLSYSPLPPPPKEKAKEILKLVTFKDLKAGDFGKLAIEKLAALGIIEGYRDGTFKPRNLVKRAELTKLLVKIKSQTVPPSTGIIFKDVPTRHWAAKYIEEASRRHLIAGYLDKTFRPSYPVTRAEGAAIFARFAALPEPKIIKTSFSDVNLKHWAAKFIQAGEEAGLYKHLEGGDFQLARELTRAEVAEILIYTPAIQALLKDVSFF